MLWAIRALLALGLLMASSHSARKGRRVLVELERGIGQRERFFSISSSRIANMSLSPWTYRETFDASRVPNRIFHAHCLTSGCLTVQNGEEDMSLEAKPIYYQFPVLRKVKKRKNGVNSGGRKRGRTYVFRLGVETVAVGCTCVKPSIVPHA